MTELPCPICNYPMRNVRPVSWQVKLLDMWTDGQPPTAVRKRGTDFSGTCDRCDKRLLVEVQGPRYAELA